MIDWFLASIPILLILGLMLGLRWRGSRSGPIAWIAAILIAYLRFGADWHVLAWAQFKGFLLALWVLYIIWAALLFYRTADEAGAVATIGTGLSRLTTDRTLQALLLGWVFASFLQGFGGFGVPVAVVAPFLGFASQLLDAILGFFELQFPGVALDQDRAEKRHELGFLNLVQLLTKQVSQERDPVEPG